MTKPRGSIIVLVLWSFSLLMAFAISLGVSARQKATLLDRLVKLDSLTFMAYSGVDRARAVIQTDSDIHFDSLVDSWSSNPGVFKDIRVGDGFYSVSYAQPGVGSDAPTLRYGLVDENRKININTATPQTLSRLLQSLALDTEQAEELANCIVDWRDGDSGYQHPRYGAEDTDYDDLAKPYAAKDSPYESVNELLLVKGMNRVIFDKIKSFVTPFGKGQVNINTASEPVLKALGCEGNVADKINRFRAGKDLKLGTSDDGFFTDTQTIITVLEVEYPLNELEKNSLTNVILGDKLAVSSTHFTAYSKGTGPSGATIQVDAVIDRNGKVLISRSSGVQWPSKV
jgi:general secretion pathway protein K